MNLDDLQLEHATWEHDNFGEQPDDYRLFGLVEEIGELFHAVLKRKQGIRGAVEEHAAAERDAIGDAMLYLVGYCSARGWSLDEIVTETWEQVRQRDWKSNPQTGGK